MSPASSGRRRRRPSGGKRDEAAFARGIARAFVGALLFSLPILMTMETWQLGFYMDPFRLALLLVLTVAMLTRLSRYGGFRPTTSILADIADAFVAIAVSAVAATLILAIFSVVGPDMPAREIIGKVALQTVPGSLGAMLARNQLGSRRAAQEREEAERTYPGEIFLMLVGAQFLSLNVAPTEEMILIAYQMSVWHQIGLAVGSLLLMHALVYALEFRGTIRTHPGEMAWSLFARYTVVGYAGVLLVSLYLLWSFGRLEAAAPEVALAASIVLAFPGAVGASLARLIL